MKISKAEFITSCADASRFYKTDKPIIAVSGKSNVGKSSLINMLAKNGKLARTSVTPGRTRLINYFDFGPFVLCDLPGYGFAKAPKSEKEKWGKLMEAFLSTQKLKLLLALVDIRHNPTSDDVLMINYLYHYAIPFELVATKSDKLPKTKVKPSAKAVADFLRVGEGNVIISSSEKGVGREEILCAIENAINVKEDTTKDDMNNQVF